jgi:hypothetical protein
MQKTMRAIYFRQSLFPEVALSHRLQSRLWLMAKRLRESGSQIRLTR